MNTETTPHRVVYMGTPEFAVPSLLALCAADQFQVVGVATQPDRPAGRKRKPTPSPVKQAALASNLPVLQPERLRNNPAAIRALAELAPDVIVVAAYGLILPKTVLEIPALGCVNVHASLLPAYRGASPITAALLDGLDETGVSIMLMDEGMDTGPVLAQAKTPIASDDTTLSLTTRLAKLGASLLVDTLTAYLQGTITPTPQDRLPGTPSLCGRIQKADGRIDWGLPAATIERMVRAYIPWPGAFTSWQGNAFKILQARVAGDHTAHANNAYTPGTCTPGTVIEIPAAGNTAENTDVAVCTGAGLLVLEQVQPAGKRGMEIASFVNGAPAFIGSTLGEENP